MLVTIVLGRDGMGANADEQAFAAWTDYVMSHIDEACGFEVGVDQAGAHDVQSDAIVGGTDEQRQTVHERVQDLWEQWCADGAPGVDTEGKKAGKS